MRRAATAFALLLLAAALNPATAAPNRPDGPIRSWVVLGAFPNPQPPGGRTATARGGHDIDYLTALGGEARAVLRPGATVAAPDGAALTARTVEATTGRLDFNAIFPESTNRVVYAFAVLDAPAGGEALFFLGSDDGAKVWLNGALALDAFPLTGRAFRARENRFRAPLRRGANTLLVKVENLTGGWELQVEGLRGSAARAVLAEEARQERIRAFLRFEFGPLQTYPSYVIDPGPLPAVGWRDPEGVKRVAGDVRMRVRWFDADLNEVTTAARPGRYMAYAEGRLRDGTPVRRSLTVYCKPPGALQLWLADWDAEVPYLGPPFNPVAWRERAPQTATFAGRLVRDSLFTMADGAIFLAGMAEARPLGRAPRFVESPAVADCDRHLALKRKVLGASGPGAMPAPPRRKAGAPAPVLREGTPEEAGVAADARARIEAVCRRWAEEAGEPFAVVVARRGVVVTEAAFGDLAPGQPCTPDFRFEVASITKAISGMLFARFVDQGLAQIDDPVARFLTGFPATGPKAITFRQCFTHTATLEGHGEWGGIWNMHLDNVILNHLGALAPGTRHIYNGVSYDLVGRALEMIAGKPIMRIFDEALFQPLGLADVPIMNMAFGARLTARELATLGQVLANRGSYGDRELYSEATHARLLPVPLKQFWPAVDVEWGIGLTHMPERRPGAPAGSMAPRDLSLGPRTIGHGSATSCILRVDPDTGVVIAMIRRTAGARYGEHAADFFAAVADALR
ncbi:MAG TPA: serine hydrolase [Chthonomonadales bacterium]|nr:serine hydrolase [Chthonomonadales bacterium]